MSYKEGPRPSTSHRSSVTDACTSFHGEYLPHFPYRHEKEHVQVGSHLIARATIQEGKAASIV